VYGEFYGNFGILGETFSILFLLGEFQGNKWNFQAAKTIFFAAGWARWLTFDVGRSYGHKLLTLVRDSKWKMTIQNEKWRGGFQYAPPAYVSRECGFLIKHSNWGGQSWFWSGRLVNNNQPTKKTQTFSTISFFEQRNPEQKRNDGNWHRARTNLG
jgi:hypothetical protein